VFIYDITQSAAIAPGDDDDFLPDPLSDPLLESVTSFQSHDVLKCDSDTSIARVDGRLTETAFYFDD
jgi:hypothetical protein